MPSLSSSLLCRFRTAAAFSWSGKRETASHTASHREGVLYHTASHREGVLYHTASHREGVLYHTASNREGVLYHTAHSWWNLEASSTFEAEDFLLARERALPLLLRSSMEPGSSPRPSLGWNGNAEWEPDCLHSRLSSSLSCGIFCC